MGDIETIVISDIEDELTDESQLETINLCDPIIDCKSEEMDIQDFLPKSNAIIAEEKKNSGNDQYKAQNYDLALRLYSESITLCPETPAYYGNRAACHMMLGNYKLALADSRQAIHLDNKFDKGYVRIAKCSLALGDVIGAQQAINTLLSIDPKSTALANEIQQCKQLRLHEEKAKECYGKGDFRTAVFHVDNLLKIASASIAFKLLRAECLLMLGRSDEASDIAVACMMTDSTNADAILVRGLCLYYMDNLDKGLNHFERALQLDPDNAKAKVYRVKAKNLRDRKELGNTLFKTFKYRDALKAYTEALEVDSQNKEVNSKIHYNRALVNSKLGNLIDAVKDCSCALEVNGSYLKAILLRARCNSSLGEHDSAVQDYEAAYKMEKTSEIRKLLRDAKFELKKSKRKDYYKILGVDKTANDDEIKKAYRKRALVHHPDRHSSATDAEKREQERKFKEVGEAYAILSDQEKKRRYDSGQDMDETDFNATDMYQQFFHFSGGGQTFSFQFQ